MARTSPTQKKRLRENKLREKAQRKRELRQQRQAEKKRPQALEDQPLSEKSVSAESADTNEPGLQMASADTTSVQATTLSGSRGLDNQTKRTQEVRRKLEESWLRNYLLAICLTVLPIMTWRTS
jgi:hypothetical protein